MPVKRMDRGQFFAKLGGLDEEHLQKALWNLYWRGNATVRERIEAEIDPAERTRRKAVTPSADPAMVHWEVGEFVELARGGSYLAGDRRVSPRERTRWRSTFGRLANDAQLALRADDPADGAAAMELLIDLAVEMRDYDYFRSDDPVAAARFVLSDAAALLWTTVRERHGFEAFAVRAAPQLLRWESRYGWTRHGGGRVSEKETSLARVLGGMLPTPEAWTGFADHYLDALDQTGDQRAARRSRSSRDLASNLAEWHLLLLDKLSGYDCEPQLDRLTSHPVLGGPELTDLRASLARRSGT